MPKHLLREWLWTVVSSVIVDMETKSIEIHVQLPKHVLESTFSSENAMRLVPTSASSTCYQTHPTLRILLGCVICLEDRIDERGLIKRPCYVCRRAA